MGIAFIEEQQVSFREEVPSKEILVHEVGHVHFQEVDSVWSSTYGGGEILFWLGVQGKYNIPEEGIRRFHSLFKKAQAGENAEVAEEIVNKVAPLFGEQIVPHFYTICLFTGWLPEGVGRLDLDPFDLKNPAWLEVEPKKNDVVSFFVNLTSGLQFFDSFWIEIAKKLQIITF